MMRVVCSAVMFAVVFSGSLTFSHGQKKEEEPASAIAASDITASDIKGHWVVVAAETDGEPLDSINYEGMQWKIGKDSLTLTPGTRTPAGLANKPDLVLPMKLNLNVRPFQMTWTTVSRGKERVVTHIFKLEEDQLVVSLGRANQDPPETFDTSKTKSIVYRMERKKEKNER